MDLAAILRGAGCQVAEVEHWRARGHGMGLVPEGVMLHHTASAKTASAASVVGLTVIGRKDLPGPLCNLTLDIDGIWHVIAAGVAYHAGKGSSSVLGRIRQGLAPLGNAAVFGLHDDMVGNSHFIGIEIQNDGVGQPYPDLQIATLRAGVDALLHAIGEGPWACVGHKEFTARKVDPSFDMPALRASLAAPLPEQHVTLPPLAPPEELKNVDLTRIPARTNEDPNGGWTVVDAPCDTVVSVLLIGSDYSYTGLFQKQPAPAADGYDPAAQTKITLAEQGNPGWADIEVWVAAPAKPA